MNCDGCKDHMNAPSGHDLCAYFVDEQAGGGLLWSVGSSLSLLSLLAQSLRVLPVSVGGVHDLRVRAFTRPAPVVFVPRFGSLVHKNREQCVGHHGPERENRR